eukprot:115873_1
MQLRKTHVGALTNNEVLIILNKQLKWHQTSQKKYKKALPKTHKLYPCQWIANEVTSYLLETPASNQTRSDIRNLLNEIEKIDIHNKLTRLEKLQIINLRPSSEPLLYSIIDQCNAKFPKQHDIDQLLHIVSQYLPESEEDEDDSDMERDND